MINKIRLTFVVVVLAAVSLPLFGAGRGEVSGGGGADDSEAAAGNGGCPDGFRIFDHDFLVGDPVCVPEKWERVSFLPYPSYLFTFDVNPVGSWGLERDAENFPFIADWIVSGTIDIGWPPNLEVLAELAPDLMIYDNNPVADIIDELPAIAPTVIYDGIRSTEWRQRHQFNGAALGQAELAESQIAVYERRIVELRGALERSLGDLKDTTVSIVRLRGEGVINLLGPWYASVLVVRELGLDLPDAVDMTLDEMREKYGSKYYVKVAEERIDSVDGDVMIVLGSPGGGGAQSIEGESVVAEMMSDPLWRSLGAFQNDSVYPKGDYWLQSNILAAHLVVDELAEIFGVRVETANPFIGGKR